MNDNKPYQLGILFKIKCHVPQNIFPYSKATNQKSHIYFTVYTANHFNK